MRSRGGSVAGVLWGSFVVGIASAGEGPAVTSRTGPGVAPPGAQIVATVNGEAITRDELVRFLTLRYGAEVVHQLLADRLIREEAARRGLTVAEEDLAEALDDAVAAAGGDAAYNELLRRRGVSRDYLRRYELPQGVALAKLGDLLLSKADETELKVVLRERYGAMGQKQLVLQHLITQELERQGLTVSEAEVKALLDSRIAESGGEAAYERRLRLAGSTRAYATTYQLPAEVAFSKLGERLKDRISADADLVDLYTQRFGRQAEGQLVLSWLLKEELARRGLTATDAEVQDLLDERVAESGQEALDRDLVASGLTLDQMKTYDLAPEAGQRKLIEALKGEVASGRVLDDLLRERYGRQVAQQVAMVRLLKDELARRGLTVTGAEVSALLASRVQESGGDETYRRILRRAGVTLDYVKAYELTTELIIRKLAERLKDEIAADPSFNEVLLAGRARQAVEHLLLMRLVRQNLDGRGLKVTEAEMEAVLAERVKESGGRPAYDDRLRRAGIPLEYIKAYELPLEAARRKLIEPTVVNDGDVRQVFEAAYGEKRRTRCIVVNDIRIANDILKLVDDGADFAELARTRSMDPRARRDGGLWPPLGRGAWGALLAPLEEIAFTTAEGKHSGVTQIGQNYYIIKVEQVIPPQSGVTFEQEEARLREVVRRQREEAAWRQLTAALRRSAKVEFGKDPAGG